MTWKQTLLQTKFVLRQRLSVGWGQTEDICIRYHEVVSMTSCELTASITALANAIACRLNEDELNLLGVILTQLGDTILTIATHRSICGNGTGEKTCGEERQAL